MQEDFIQPRTVSTPIPVDSLKPEEREKLTSLGIDLQRHEAIASDLLERIEKSTLDADTVNRLAIEEMSDDEDLDTLHPDIAQSIREAAAGETLKSRPIEDIMRDMDEDAEDQGQVPKPDLTDEGESPVKSADEVNEVLRTLLDTRYKNRQKYRASITDQDRDDILNEIFTGKRFTRVFKFFGGRLIMTLGTLTADQTDAIADFVSGKVNTQSMTVDQYNAYRGRIKAVMRIESVLVSGKVVYQYAPNMTVEEVANTVESKIGKSESFRQLLAEADREITGLLEGLLEDASYEVFTAPAYADIG